MQPGLKKEWLDSKATRKALRISACELSHLRAAGRIRFQKRSNAFLYSGRDGDLLAPGKKHRPPK